MKNQLKFAFVAASFIFISACGGKKSVVNPNGRCEKELQNFSAAATTFGTASTKKNCAAYVASLDALVNNCSFLSAVDKAQYKKDRADINCNDL